MSKKEEVLNQLNQIHSSLMDNEKFIPFNYGVLIMWGVISAILILTFDNISIFGVWYGIAYIGGVVILGFFVERYFTKKENKKYDLKEFTLLQKFVETNYTFCIIFAIVLTYIFVSNSVGVYSYLSWMFLIGYADFVTGFVLNNKRFTAVGLLNISASIAIITITFIFSPLVIALYIKYISAIFVGGGLIYLGISIKKECSIV